MIRLVLIFLPFLFILLPTCYLFGDIVLEKLKLEFNKYLKVCVGFISIISLFQILYYPAMILQLPSLYLTICGLAITLFLIFLDIKYFKKIKNFYKDKYILGILFMAFIFFFLYMRTVPEEYFYYDDSFYLPLMYHNANTNKLFSIEPRVGTEVNSISKYYMYQGYYLIGSFFISIFNIFKDIFSLKFSYVSIVLYFMSVPTFTILFFTFLGLIKQNELTKLEKILFGLCGLFYIIYLPIDSNIYNNIFMTGYSGVFSSLTVIYPFLMFVVFNFYKHKNYKFLLVIIFFALLSYASFNLFNIVIILFIMLLFQMINNSEINYNDYLLLSFPALLYISAFLINNNFISMFIFIMIMLLYIIYFKFIIKKHNLISLNKFNKYFKPILLGISFFPVIASIIMVIFSISIKIDTLYYINTLINDFFPLFGSYKFHYSYIPITIFYIILCYLLIFNVYKRRYESADKKVIWFIVLIGLIFLNPLAIPFISTTMTSEVFSRIFPLIFNPLVMFIILKPVINSFKWKKCLAFLMIMFIVGISLTELKSLSYTVGQTGGSEKVYRMRPRDVIAYIKLEKYLNDYNVSNPVLASNHSDMRILNPKIVSSYDRFISLTPNESFTKYAYYQLTLYRLNQGIINTEYLQDGDTLYDAIKYLGVNLITVDIKCLDNEVIDDIGGVCVFDKEKVNDARFIEANKIYNDLLKHLDLVYETDRYRLYYVGD